MSEELKSDANQYPGGRQSGYSYQKIINELEKENQRLREGLETIASGQLPDGDLPSQPVVMYAEEILAETEEDQLKESFDDLMDKHGDEMHELADE